MIPSRSSTSGRDWPTDTSESAHYVFLTMTKARAYPILGNIYLASHLWEAVIFLPLAKNAEKYLQKKCSSKLTVSKHFVDLGVSSDSKKKSKREILKLKTLRGHGIASTAGPERHSNEGERLAKQLQLIHWTVFNHLKNTGLIEKQSKLGST